MDADKFQRILDRDGDRLQKIKKRFTSYRVLSDGTKKQIITDRDIEWLIDKIERLGGAPRLEAIGSELEKDRDYQRRHRAWALVRAIRNRGLLTYECEKFNNSNLAMRARAQRAEARVKDLEARLRNLQDPDGGGHVIY